MKILIQKEAGGTVAIYTARDRHTGGKSSYTTGVTPEMLSSVVAEHLRNARPFEQLDLPESSQESA